MDQLGKGLAQLFYQVCHAGGGPAGSGIFHDADVMPRVKIEVAPLDHVDVRVPNKIKKRLFFLLAICKSRAVQVIDCHKTAFGPGPFDTVHNVFKTIGFRTEIGGITIFAHRVHTHAHTIQAGLAQTLHPVGQTSIGVQVDGALLGLFPE